MVEPTDQCRLNSAFRVSQWSHLLFPYRCASGTCQGGGRPAPLARAGGSAALLRDPHLRPMYRRVPATTRGLLAVAEEQARCALAAARREPLRALRGSNFAGMEKLGLALQRRPPALATSQWPIAEPQAGACHGRPDITRRGRCKAWRVRQGNGGPTRVAGRRVIDSLLRRLSKVLSSFRSEAPCSRAWPSKSLSLIIAGESIAS